MHYVHYVHYVHERAGKRGGMTKIFQLPLKGVSVVHAVLFFTHTMAAINTIVFLVEYLLLGRVVWIKTEL